MKKLVMFIAVAVAAVGVQAATLSWSLMNMLAPGGGDAPVGTLVALYAAGTAYDHDAAKAGTLTPTYTSTAVAVNTTSTATRAGETGLGSYSAGDTASFYAVVYDSSTIAGASNYIISDVVTATVPAAGSNISLAYGNMKATTTANRFKNALDQGWTSAGVPEPTSALLLLMGGAMLALRRKRS